MTLWLFGPHAVEGALVNDAGNVLQIWISRERKDQRSRSLIDSAEELAIRVSRPPRAEFDRRFAGKVHQGMAAEYQEPALLDEKDLVSLINERALLLVLDHVQDPRNFGACLRSAAAAGVTAVIFPKDRSASVTPLARKTASGAAERLNLVQVTNLATTLRWLKRQNVWLVGADGSAPKSIYDIDLTGAIGLVVGNEGEGLKRLTAKHCDFLARIPMTAQMESLNVSVATGIVLFEAVRQRRIG
nr:23S rRNA (guanosine-2'-O-)-methyltransferase RlmB-like [Nerophis lumbriciformis]